MFDRFWKTPKQPKLPLSPNSVGALFEAQVRFFEADSALTVIDAGVHFGHSSKEYLDAFPRCRVLGFEPEDKNFAAATEALASYGSRVSLFRNALSGDDATTVLQVNTHDGTHSLLEIGDGRYWQGDARTVGQQQVQTVSLGRFCAVHRIDTVDILKMDIQGGELQALKGAAGLLERGAISVIALEVLFQPLYKDQPLFWDVAAHLRTFGYGLHGLFECQYHSANPKILNWADAIFIAPKLQALGLEF